MLKIFYQKLKVVLMTQIWKCKLQRQFR